MDQQHKIDEAVARRDQLFWRAQLVIWPAYGAALMLPWLGEFSVRSMLPSKAAIALTAILISAALRELYWAAERRGVNPGTMMGLVFSASVLGGVTWNGLLSAWLGISDAPALMQQGMLGSGIPQFAGGLYHALVMLSWSMTYLGFKHLRAVHHEPEQSMAIARSSSVPTHVVLRDGRRKVVMDTRDIGWVEAERDYVRIHTGTKQLLFRTTLTRLEQMLPACDFIRIHRSTLIRADQIRELRPLPNSEFQVRLRDGTVLKASRTFSDRLQPLIKS